MSYPQFNQQPTAKPIDRLFLDRLRQFTDGGRYRELNLPKFYDLERRDVALEVWKVPDHEGKTARPLFRDIDFDSIEWLPAKKGDSFGPSWKSFWFKVEWEIPELWLKHEEIDFDWDCSNEGLIYTTDGAPLQAFTGGDRTLFKLPKLLRRKGPQRFYLEIACNGMFGNGDGGVPDPNRYFRLNRADLVLPDVGARRLYWDFWILSDAARELPDGGTKYQAAAACNAIMNAFDPEDRGSIGRCRAIAAKLLGEVDELVFSRNPLRTTDVWAVGNCHIDTAWLWPFAETRRKIVRLWTTQLKLAEEYPEYVFVALQMQQFEWLKQDHPDVLRRIKKKHAAGQFLPIGGLWVEHDTNMPGSELLVRQFLLGQRWLASEFGTTASVFWLPDTFGYSLQIPQVCRHTGIHRFVTQKLSWNNINTFPLSTFNWKLIDGSQVVVHMPPANTYTAQAHFGDVVRLHKQHKNLRDVPTGMLLYGFGDGGGGPTEEMVEKLRRCRGLANTTGAIPLVHLGNTVEEYFDDVLERLDHGTALPTWTGEIYLEFHRGTYTTQADVKKWMRRVEAKMHDLELVATVRSLTLPYRYPAREIRALWEDICLCQFHDVLPGLCIGMVYYDEVKPMLTRVLAQLDDLTHDALADDWVAIDKGDLDVALLSLLPRAINTLPWDRVELVDGALFHTQAGFATLAHPALVTHEKLHYVLTNGLLTARISTNGLLVSLKDQHGREAIDPRVTKQSSGAGNQLVLFDDEPLLFPAWDTELYSLDKFRLVDGGEVVLVHSAAAESHVVVRHELSLRLWIETKILLQGLANAACAQNNFVRFSCTVEWREFYKFLKVQFPTTVHTAQQALYETQFGVTQRPTHYNTTWDVAKFEVCHHRFMDLSERDYGVAVLNDGKYGASVHGNLMRLSLLRSAKAPDDKADMGRHTFSYAVYPHAGPLGPDVVHLAYNFNQPLVRGPAAAESLTRAISLKGDPALIISAVKRAEDDEDVNTYENIEPKHKGKQLAIVRVYESLGGAGKGSLVFEGLKVAKAFRANGLEEVEEELPVEKNAVAVSLRAFEIATFKVVFE